MVLKKINEYRNYIITYDLSEKILSNKYESKHSQFKDEIYELYNKIEIENELPNTTLLIKSDKNINLILHEIKLKFKNKFNINKLVIAEYSNIKSF